PPFDIEAANRFSQMVGKGMSVMEFSSPFSNCESTRCTQYEFPDTAMENARRYGAIPMLGWGSESTPWDTYNPVQPDYELSDLISGRYDAYIRQFAEAARNWGHPFFLRFNWEMNGNWFPWGVGVGANTAPEFVAAWRRVHDIFASVGATNAT